MRVVVMALAVSSVATPTISSAGDTEKALQLRPKAAMMSAVASVTPAQSNAPFVQSLGPGPGQEPELEIFSSRQDSAQEASRSSCNGERSLCYDSVSGRVVYKPARQFMPSLPGLRPENISLKRNQLVFRYSF
jgi:hypothetical protein